MPERVFMQNGSRACFRACVASLLGLDLDAIPAELDPPADEFEVSAYLARSDEEQDRRSHAWWARWAAWLDRRGLVLALHTSAPPAGRDCWIALVRERDDLPSIHSVVRRGAEVLHDPDPDRTCVREGGVYVCTMGVTIDRTYLDGECVTALTRIPAVPGGTWSGAGDADDFAVEATGHTARRTAVSDSAATNGRYAIAGTGTLTNTLVQVDHNRVNGFGGGTQEAGVLARYTDTSNWLKFVFETVLTTTAEYRLKVVKCVGGSAATIASYLLGTAAAGFQIKANTWYTLRMVVDASGSVAAWWAERDQLDAVPVILVQDSALATGGALASGKVGIYDALTGAVASTRDFDNFIAAPATTDAVIFSGRSAEIRHDAAIRQDSGGTYYGPIHTYRGSRFLLPEAGDENRPSRLAVFARRNDIEAMACGPVTDATAVQIAYRSRYTAAPR